MWNVLHDWLGSTWEEARDYVSQELEAIRVALSSKWGVIFNIDDTLTVDAISGNGRVLRRYVANTGTNFRPKWEKAVYLVQTDGTYIQGGPISETGTISATTMTSATLEAAQHTLLGGM